MQIGITKISSHRYTLDFTGIEFKEALKANKIIYHFCIKRPVKSWSVCQNNLISHQLSLAIATQANPANSAMKGAKGNGKDVAEILSILR